MQMLLEHLSKQNKKNNWMPFSVTFPTPIKPTKYAKKLCGNDVYEDSPPAVSIMVGSFTTLRHVHTIGVQFR